MFVSDCVDCVWVLAVFAGLLSLVSLTTIWLVCKYAHVVPSMWWFIDTQVLWFFNVQSDNIPKVEYESR